MALNNVPRSTAAVLKLHPQSRLSYPTAKKQEFNFAAIKKSQN